MKPLKCDFCKGPSYRTVRDTQDNIYHCCKACKIDQNRHGTKLSISLVFKRDPGEPKERSLRNA